MKVLQTVLFIYTLGVTSFFIIYSFYNYELTATVKQAKSTIVEPYIDPVRLKQLVENNWTNFI